jgi:orotate phosphoribosyltransferase
MSDDLGARLKAASLLEGDFVLRSGKRSKVYLDKYLFETQPVLLADIAVRFADALGSFEPVDVLAGPELGAVALVTAVSLQTGKPFVIVRKAEKDYGTRKLFEGRAEPGQRVVVVEDVVTTGGAALSAVERLRDSGLDVLGLLCVVDREQGGAEAFAAADVPFVPLFTAAGLGIRIE